MPKKKTKNTENNQRIPEDEFDETHEEADDKLLEEDVLEDELLEEENTDESDDDDEEEEDLGVEGVDEHGPMYDELMEMYDGDELEDLSAENLLENFEQDWPTDLG